MPAVAASCKIIEATLGSSSAFRKIDDRLYVVKQGSSYVMISVLGKKRGAKADAVVVRVVAQVVSGVRPEPTLMKQLLVLNGTLRFGAFAYVPDGHLILFSHTILGGEGMDPRELLATVHDVAIVADEYDDRIVQRYGGARMQDIVEQSALDHIFGDTHHDQDL